MKLKRLAKEKTLEHHSNKPFKFPYALPLKVKEEMKERVLKDGYSFNQKSQWIEEAVIELLEANSFIDTVLDLDMAKFNDSKDTVTFSGKMKQILFNAEVKIRLEALQQAPPILINGARGAILRAAITKRMMKR